MGSPVVNRIVSILICEILLIFIETSLAQLTHPFVVIVYNCRDLSLPHIN